MVLHTTGKINDIYKDIKLDQGIIIKFKKECPQREYIYTKWLVSYFVERLGGNMVSEIDKRNRLKEEPFNYQITKKGTVIIYYEGKQIKIVKDGKAAQLIEKLNAAEDIMEVQLLLAKITGNFKHGNEKNGKNK